MAVLIWALAAFWRAPMLAGKPGMVFVVSPLTAVPFALVLAYGVAVIAVLFWGNRHRLRRVLRWNLGRVIGAVALAFVTPLAVLDWVPVILGGVMGAMLVAGGGEGVQWGLGFALILAGVAVLWYPVSALIVSGTRSRWLRFGLFCLMFWSGYAALVLFSGVAHFSL